MGTEGVRMVTVQLLITDLEKLIGLKSEGDVVNASSLYLTHPVHVAYQTVHPTDCYLNELTKTRQDGTSSSRVDRAYFWGPPNDDLHPGDSTNIFAALEYKKSGAINRAQFRRGRVTGYNAFDDAQQNSRYVDRNEEDNVMVLLKQAVHYVWRYETPFVALCDYKTLILLYMPKQETNSGGPYTYMTIVQGETKDMRKATPRKCPRNVEAELHVYGFESQLSLSKELEHLLHSELYLHGQRDTRSEEANSEHCACCQGYDDRYSPSQWYSHEDCDDRYSPS
ncbi:hypothetical protein INS49_005584 [Diaporthe citri]|uniref:uncharacterized protein n=1 Tax=Diaporthe citri TaxID=83186 RepID=UPI001C7EE160|nr:uncharacterized protein INS49_005584 [Diaporthe citri]KAG6353403.1 hypothetical protein INS49_005584 [Diaporthe citri]